MIFPPAFSSKRFIREFFFEIGTFLNILPTVVLEAVTTTELQFRILSSTTLVMMAIKNGSPAVCRAFKIKRQTGRKGQGEKGEIFPYDTKIEKEKISETASAHR